MTNERCNGYLLSILKCDMYLLYDCSNLSSNFCYLLFTLQIPVMTYLVYMGEHVTDRNGGLFAIVIMAILDKDANWVNHVA